MRELFGTDGIRGIANRYPMTAEIALRVGRATAHYFRGRSLRSDKKSIVLIGKDTRRSSYMIEQALAAGVTSQGAMALLVGPMPTPGVAFLTNDMRADAGIVVSASHNSYEYNGIKIFGHDGYKLADAIEEEIERLVLSDDFEERLPVGVNLGSAKRIDDAMGRYVVHAKSCFPNQYDLKGMKIVLDCAHGAAYKFAPLVFNELGAEVIEVASEPNGVNINKEVGALFPECARDELLKSKAHIGISLDGDADRVILTDEKGEVVDGDQILGLLAADLHARGELAKASFVTTPMSNIGLEIAMKERGISVLTSGIGDREVVDLMRKEKLNFGGEQSGHLIFTDLTTTGDGVIAALSVIAAMKRAGKPLSELKKIVQPVPQILKNVRVSSKPVLEQLKEVSASIAEGNKKLKGRGRILVRYSGTEPLCRVMIEGEEKSMIEKIAMTICEAIEREINHKTLP
jgi:phosphoglucosamine mutase